MHECIPDRDNPGLLTRCAMLMVRAYQVIAGPYLGGQCRYYPSCSQYSLDAFRKYGFVRGLGKTAWRILRCNPFSPGGIDYP
jgi:putative membrane protein insertion efficiency factor